jgi:hypothetical protein
MEAIRSLDDWNQTLFFSICALLVFMMLFKISSISEILTEGLMNMK